MTEDISTKVYIPQLSLNQSGLIFELNQTILRAGMRVLSSISQKEQDSHADFFKNSHCIVLHLESREKNDLIHHDNNARIKEIFYQAKDFLKMNTEYKIIIWQPMQQLEENSFQDSDFINEVKNNLSRNMIYSTTESMIQFVEDLRSLTEVKKIADFKTSATDIFLISNQLDDNTASEIAEMLSDIVPVEKLNIIQDSDIDYSELCKQQIPQSKLAVVYYKNSTDWAIPFTQQVWKKIGGASSHTPILLIGDEDPNINENKKFNAPKVISLIVAGELIPLEIKVQYDKITENNFI